MIVRAELPRAGEVNDFWDLPYQMPVAQGAEGRDVDHRLAELRMHLEKSILEKPTPIADEQPLGDPFRFKQQIKVRCRRIGRLATPLSDDLDDD